MSEWPIPRLFDTDPDLTSPPSGRTCADPLHYQLTEPISRGERFRIEMTVSCRDCDPIPKVDNAGQVVLTERGERVQIMHNGVRVLAGAYVGDWMTEVITRLHGHHEPQEELVFHEVLKRIPPQAIMIELGGYWSYYSLWFLKDAPGRRSIVVEPDPRHLAIGSTNARLNDLHIGFRQASAGARSIPAHAFQAETTGRVVIPQVTVTQLLDEHDIDRLDLLHCDVQGAETDILQSSKQLLSSGRIRFCFVSTHSHHISGDALTHQRCLALLQEAGGQILAEHDVHESYSGDGLIVAHFGEPLSWPALSLSYNRYSTSLFRNPLFDLDEAKQQEPPQSE